MTDHGQSLLYSDNVAALSPVASDARRRGSVLILVMTLLGVMFVMGIAFLATMNFEAGQISSDRQRGLTEVGVNAIADDFGSMMRDGLLSAPGTPFGANLLGATSVSFAELPGVQNAFAPIEPTRVIDPGYPEPRYVYPWITDAYSLKNNDGRPDGAAFRELTTNGFIDPNGILFDGIDTRWPSGVPISNPDLDPALFTYPPDIDTGAGMTIYPVDSDGDGITDTLQFPAERLGFSKAQTLALSRQLNTAINPTGEVFVAMRTVAHGGLVNLNESHPALIRNIFFELPDTVNLTDAPNTEYDFFLHRPSHDLTPYSPLAEESMLRRRGLLPPQVMPPSLLHGNPFDPSVAGRADMFKLIPPSNDGRFGLTTSGNHRYTPFDPNQRWIPNDPDSDPLWAVRMEPFASYRVDARGSSYDRRHLVTTISHDDLLSRGGTIERFVPGTGELLEELDLRDRMIEINRAAWDPDECPLLPFEYADYPITIRNGGNCGCPTERNCEFNARKGRLQLSLAWLDDAYTDNGLDDDLISENARRRLIHDVFMMLVRNARGPYWDADTNCAENLNACDPAGEICDAGDELCHDKVTGQTRRLSRLSRTAASLTANMIDFMDFDDDANDGVDDNVPTRVPLRSFDFSETTCDDASTNLGAICMVDAECIGGRCVAKTAGWEFHSTRIPNIARQYVYGLERQPYITEVATNIPIDDAPPDAWAVELYNPYDVDLVRDADGDGMPDWWLVVLDPAGVLQPPIPLPSIANVTIKAGEFTAFTTDASLVSAGGAGHGSIQVLSGTTPLSFAGGSIIYLVRGAYYPDDDHFGDLVWTEIVVDQFLVDGVNIGGGSGATVGVYSLQRVIPNENARWTATVPKTIEIVDHSLGNWNGYINTNVRPVEVNFANTGSFTRPLPDDDPITPVLGVAFPTTGSLLLLMRHANRALFEYTLLGASGVAVDTENLSFTSWLDDEPTWFEPDPDDPLDKQVSVTEWTQVDNGRMPIYDPPTWTCGGLAYEESCDDDITCLGLQCMPGRAAHHVMPKNTPANEPGDLSTLPWGQLVFDYFTVLPLESYGPYSNPTNDPDFDPAEPDSIPRVDLDGLRVHGRININAAPWKVLAGLPLTPMQRMPVAFRPKVRAGSGLVRVPPASGDELNPIIPDDLFFRDEDAASITNDLAMSVVAYRGGREITFDTAGGIVTTGDYGEVDPLTGLGGMRGWYHNTPSARRGTGFATVGELANVRSPEATDGAFRFDLGEVDQPDSDYVRAVAQLVALGDWVTVRSHVFTVYGTVRGELDPDLLAANPLQAAADVDTRALRFQETVDRLPTFLGEPSPVRIGERVLRKYRDARND